jgi:hypothetical protein
MAAMPYWLVTDVDDTLLRADQYLGSHAWFAWQADLLGQDPASRALVAGSFDGLLAAQALIHALGRMRPPQPELPTLLEDLQNRGIRVIALTSRGRDPGRQRPHPPRPGSPQATPGTALPRPWWRSFPPAWACRQRRRYPPAPIDPELAPYSTGWSLGSAIRAFSSSDMGLSITQS